MTETTRVRIDGGEGIATVARAVRAFGANRTIVNEMAKEIRGAVPPVRDAIRRNALSYLPSRGGLAGLIAGVRVTARVRRGAKTAGVTLVGARSSRGRRHDLKRLDAGATRHPTFGRRPWVPQTVRARFFTDAAQTEGAEAFREAVVVAVDRAARRLLR